MLRSPMMRLRALAIDTLDLFHLGNTARKTKQSMRHFKNAAKARGLWSWTNLVPEDAFTECCRRAIRTLKGHGHEPFGVYLEFGVSRGTSLASMHRALDLEGMHDLRLFGFDSFQGMPPEALEEGWLPGDYRSTLTATRKYLERKHVKLERVTLVEGWFSDTLKRDTMDRLKLSKASLIMVDCDIYSASRDALWFSEPLIVDRAVIFFDDWGWRSDIGEIGQKEAFAEFLAAFPSLTAEPLPSYLPQARTFLVTRHPATDEARQAPLSSLSTLH